MGMPPKDAGIPTGGKGDSIKGLGRSAGNLIWWGLLVPAVKYRDKYLIR